MHTLLKYINKHELRMTLPQGISRRLGEKDKQDGIFALKVFTNPSIRLTSFWRLFLSEKCWVQQWYQETAGHWTEPGKILQRRCYLNSVSMSQHKKTVGGEIRRKRTFTDVWCTHGTTCQLCFPKKDISAYLLLQSSRHAPFGDYLNQEQKSSPRIWNQGIWSFQLSGMLHIKTGSIKTNTPPLKLNQSIRH